MPDINPLAAITDITKFNVTYPDAASDKASTTTKVKRCGGAPYYLFPSSQIAIGICQYWQ